MNEPRDPFEEELSELSPREVSPALRGRIASSLSGAPPGRSGRHWPLALAGGLAAACLAFALFSGGGGGGGGVGPGPPDVSPRPAPVAVASVDDSTPRLLAYQRALARSPEDLGALLDRQALVLSGPRSGPPPIRGFSRSDTSLRSLLGDD